MNRRSAGPPEGSGNANVCQKEADHRRGVGDVAARDAFEGSGRPHRYQMNRFLGRVAGWLSIRSEELNLFVRETRTRVDRPKALQVRCSIARFLQQLPRGAFLRALAL